MKVKSLSHVQLLATPWTTAYQYSVHGILQARVLEWGAIAFSGESAIIVCVYIYIYIYIYVYMHPLS